MFNIFRKKKSKSPIQTILLHAFWIYNNYGIPVNEAVLASSSSRGNSKKKLFISDLYDNPELNELLIVVTGTYFKEFLESKNPITYNSISYEDLKQMGIPMQVREIEIYNSDKYNFLNFAPNTAQFLQLDFDLNNYPNEKLMKIKNKIESYNKHFDNSFIPKLIIPFPALQYEGLKLDEVKSQATEIGLSYENHLKNIKDEVEEILKLDFIPYSRIYGSDVMSAARWQKGFVHLTIYNEIHFTPHGDYY